MPDHHLTTPEAHGDLTSLFESAPDLMFTGSLSGRITRVNLAFERITGYSRTEALEKSFLDLVVPEQKHQIEKLLLDLENGAVRRTPRSEQWRRVSD